MGPGDGIQIQRLMDLPTTLETADSVSNPNISSPLQATQATPGGPGQATVPTRVKSMFQQQSPGGKLPSSSKAVTIYFFTDSYDNLNFIFSFACKRSFMNQLKVKDRRIRVQLSFADFEHTAL